jgi:hypothetical protein
MSSAPETNEFEFAHKICHALEETAASLPATTVNKLAAARRVALARKKPEAELARAFVPVLAPAGAASGLQRAPLPERRVPPLRRFVRILPILALVGGVAVIAYWENLQRAAELADIDAAMLNDELPLNAYLDHGFNAYLSRAR